MTSQAPHVIRTRVRAGRRAARAEDPDRLARPRRRLRQQGAGLPGLRRRDRGLAPARAAGEVDRGPHREPDLDRVRARLPHARRAGAARRRQDARPPDVIARRRPGRLLRRRPAERSSRSGLFHSSPAPTTSRPRTSTADGAYTNKAPGGVAYRCSFRVTEASYLIERLVQNAAVRARHGPGRVPPEELHRDGRSSRTSPPTGFVYDSGDYRRRDGPRRSRRSATSDLRKEQAEARERGPAARASASRRSPRSSGAGPHKDYDILGLKMFDSAELRVHPTGKAILKIGSKTQGQGHETTFAQIVAHELGIPPEDIMVEEGDTDNTPYGLGTYASRSTPDGRRGHRDGVAQAARQGAEARRAPARGRPRTTSSGRRAGSTSRARPTRR